MPPHSNQHITGKQCRSLIKRLDELRRSLINQVPKICSFQGQTPLIKLKIRGTRSEYAAEAKAVVAWLFLAGGRSLDGAPSTNGGLAISSRGGQQLVSVPRTTN